MEHQHKEFSFKRIFSSGLWVFLTGFSWELVEEILESVIAEALTDLIALFIAKVFLTFAVILSTQLVKKLLKKILRPIIKKLTYREGNDKVNKIKSFFTWVGSKIGAGFKWIWANKKSILGTLGAVASGVATAIATNSDLIYFLPELIVFEIDVVPYIAGLVIFILTELGVSGKGFETIKTFFERKATEKTEREQKQIVKEAKKKLKAEEKVANQTQAQKEKEDAKKLADEKAKAEKAKAEAEHKAKVDQVMAQLKAQQQAEKVAK